MLYRLLISSLLSLICSVTAFSQPELLPRADSLAKIGADPLLLADAYNAAWAHDKALAALEATGRKDAATLWRMARSHIDKGENLTGDPALKLFEQAQNEAEDAVRLDQENADAQQTLAIALGRVALYKGVFSSVGLVKRIYPAAHRALALNDSMPRCHYIIGRLHQELTVKPALALKLLGLGWASEDSIAWHYQRALKINPSLIQTRVAYAEYLLKAGKEPAKAKRLIDEALALPETDEQDGKAKEEARGLKRSL